MNSQASVNFFPHTYVGCNNSGERNVTLTDGKGKVSTI